MAGKFTCRELIEIVTAYYDGALAAGDREQFEYHLRRCPPCRTFLDQFRKTVEAVGHLEPEEIAPPEQERLVALFRGWKASEGD